MRAIIGSEANFQASFVNNGNPISLSGDPELKFFYDGAQVFGNVAVAMQETIPGSWEASVVVPESAIPGQYRAVWVGDDGGEDVTGEQYFELVISQNDIALHDAEFSLRRRLRDVLASAPSDDGAFFLNDEIHTLLAMNEGDIIGASYDGWMIRAAHYSTLVDVNESGSDRKLSQMFKNAMAMAEFYRKARDGSAGSHAAAIAGRVVGQTVNLRGEYVDTFGLAASANYRAGQSRGACVRIFPLHRFMGNFQLLPSV